MSATHRRYSDTESLRSAAKSPLLRKRAPQTEQVEDAGYGSMPSQSEWLKEKDKLFKKSENGSSVDDFGDELIIPPTTGQGHKNIKSGRQRKKIASRTKGGEFQARRKKRRLYFCCVASELDVEAIEARFQTPLLGLKGKMYDEVLHLYTERSPDLSIDGAASSTKDLRSISQEYINYDGVNYGTDNEALYTESTKAHGEADLVGGKEVFVFDFGAVVFWGCSREETHDLLTVVREHIVKGRLSQTEFEAGEDDMAFVTAYDADSISIANDVIMLPEHTSAQMRLAVSFAIAQSAVLSIFEDRIEDKIEDYKFIPEQLARSGKVALTHQQLGEMIGEVFVIRHEVNLHSEILDIPDYFWKANAVEPLYRMSSMYLEMEPRTEVLNKRLDLLQELLRLVQHQHENGHLIKLEWIVIWLIVISVILELYNSLSEYFNWFPAIRV